VEVAKALGGSFKLVTLAPKTVREMTHCSGKHKTSKNKLQADAINCESRNFSNVIARRSFD